MEVGEVNTSGLGVTWFFTSKGEGTAFDLLYLLFVFIPDNHGPQFLETLFKNWQMALTKKVVSDT